MKVEVGTFTPSTSGVTVILDDGSLQVKGVMLQVRKSANSINLATGFDDGLKSRGGWNLSDTAVNSNRDSSFSIYAKKNSGGSPADAVKGKVDGAKFSNVGEMEFSFAVADAGYSIDFMAFGD